MAITSQQLKTALDQAKQNPQSPFATELKNRIDSGRFDAQLDEIGLARTPAGLQKKQSQLKEPLEDIKGIGTDIMESAKKSSERIKESGQAFESGEQSALRSGLQQLGAGANFASGVISAGVKGVTKAILSENAESKLKEVANKFGEEVAKRPEVQKIVQWYDKLPEKQQRDIDAVGGFLSLAGDLAGGEVIKAGAKPVITASKEAVEGVANNIKRVTVPELAISKTVKDLAKDITPRSSDLRDRAIAKALRLAPTEDISAIEQSTGNKIGEYMSKFNLIKDTPEETVEALTKFQRKNFDLTRDAIALVDERFKFQDIPEVETTIDFLVKDLSGRKSAEYVDAVNRLKEIKKRGDLDLTEAQYIKNLFDDVESVYKRTGEVRDAINAQDKAQTIAPVRRFIEDRVQEVYPEIDIKGLNNNVQTSRAIIDAVVKRAPKADTASLLQLGDFAVLGIGNAQAPGLGFATLFGKKVIESSPVQLRFARAMAKRAERQALDSGEVVKGLDLKKLEEMDKLVRSELTKALQQGDESLINDMRKLQKEIQSTKSTKSIVNTIKPSKTPKKNKSK